MIFVPWRGLSRTAIALALLPGLATQGTPAQQPSSIARVAENARPIPVDRGASATWQALKKLRTRASLLMIVAHPDDEDGATLAYESRGMGVRTDLLTLDRGEGGANVMSSDLWDALGLVRSEELLQAGRYYGLDHQYFTTMADYGFSKSLEEAVGKWGHDRVLADAVRVVRMSRPLVVCSVFVGGPTDGHGQHATAGLMAQEVFKVAGDPKMFPEQIRDGLRPWTPLKVYARTPFFRTSAKGSYDYATHTWGPLGVTNHVTGKWEEGPVATTVALPAGTYDDVLGETYPQISREGLGFQKSQNGGTDIPLTGPQAANYHRFGSHLASADKEQTFFDGIDTSVNGIADLAGKTPPAFLTTGLRSISDLIDGAAASFSAQKPAETAAALARGLQATDDLVAAVEKGQLGDQEKYDVLHELHAKQREFNEALVAALGVSLEADVVPAPRPDALAEFRGAQQTFGMATPGKSFHVRVHLFQGSPAPLTVDRVELVSTSGKNWSAQGSAPAPRQLDAGKAADVLFTAKVPDDEPYTRPYFSRSGLEDAFYTAAPGAPHAAPFAPYPLEAQATLTYAGVHVQLAGVVQVVNRLVGPGTVRYPMPVGPPVSVAISPDAGIIPLGEKSLRVGVHLHNNVEGAAKETVHLAMPAGWRSEPASIPVEFTQLGEEQSVSFTVFPQVAEGKTYEITAVSDLAGKPYSEGYVTVGYTGLRPYFLYSTARFKTTAADVKMAPGENIAYITGSGDDIPSALEELGIHVSFLSAQDLAGADLSHFDAIVVGVRAYAVRPDLVANNSRLLRYVENGGVVIVQYNTPEFDHNFGPYPYVMTGDPEEVTDEASRVTILQPNNPVFNWPNKITTRDFDGWIEERGSKFLSTWDPKYEALLETHDQGQPEQKGGFVYARYGKGVYMYNAYAFYRQLPLGVPGAFRLFANMLSLPKNPGLQGSK